MGLPRSGDAEQGLRLHTRIESRCELLYGPRLVTCRLVLTVYPESVPRRILHTETSGSFSWVVKRRASGTYDPIILRTRAFSRSFRRRYDAKHGSVERTCRWIPAFYPGLCRRFFAPRALGPRTRGSLCRGCPSRYRSLRRKPRRPRFLLLSCTPRA